MRSPFFLCILMIGCSDKASAPKDVLPQDKMQNILYDVIRAGEMVELRKYSDSTYNTIGKTTSLFDTIFQIHGVKKESFQKSLRFYQSRPDLLKEMMDVLQKQATDTSSGNQIKPKIK